MNPEGKKTPNTSSSLDERIRLSIEGRDQTKPSQPTTGQTTTTGQTQTPLQQKLAALKATQPQSQQTQPSVYLPGETKAQFEQRMTAKMNPEQLAKYKQSSPHLFSQNQTPKPPSASSGPSPS